MTDYLYKNISKFSIIILFVLLSIIIKTTNNSNNFFVVSDFAFFHNNLIYLKANYDVERLEPYDKNAYNLFKKQVIPSLSMVHMQYNTISEITINNNSKKYIEGLKTKKSIKTKNTKDNTSLPSVSSFQLIDSPNFHKYISRNKNQSESIERTKRYPIAEKQKNKKTTHITGSMPAIH
jgi:hypothetical protein